MPLPAGRDARWVAEEYLRFLPSLPLPRIRVDVTGERAAFRLAGTRICEHHGRELRGVDFLKLWQPLDQQVFRRQLELLAAYGGAAVTGVAAAFFFATAFFFTTAFFLAAVFFATFFFATFFFAVFSSAFFATFFFAVFSSVFCSVFFATFFFTAFSSVFFYADSDALLLNGRINNLQYGSFAPGAPDVFINDDKFRRLWLEPERRYLCVEGPQLPRITALVGEDRIEIVKEAGGKFLLTNLP